MARVKIVFAAVVLLAAAYLTYEIVTFPRVSRFAVENPGTTAWMELRERQAREAGKKPRRSQVWVPLGRISPNLKDAVLIAEDAAFFHHEGLDYHEIEEAVRAGAERLEFVRGASTITQQLAKNLYLSPSRNPVRKLKELVLTVFLERRLTKDRIFEIYLNVIEWGDGIYGAEAASRAYFAKACQDLTEPEAAALAAVIINPRRYSPVRPNKRILARVGMIQARMARYRHYR